MDYLNQWRAIEARIEGLSEAAHLHVALLQVRNSDSFGRGRVLGSQSLAIFSSIESFVQQFRQSLPVGATAAIDTFIAARRMLFNEERGTPDVHDERNRAVLVLLAALKSEISFLLHDIQPAIKARSELAFAHLQRSIAADPDFRTRWQAAYATGEVACERLGAVHLLSHGIYAFKASAAGARTDLVFQDAILETPQYVQGVVLTEWKKATSNSTERAFGEARRQAEQYTPGIFSGSELTGYRYAVVVSDKLGDVPADVQSQGVEFRHVLISVDPTSPSVAARKPTKR
jgi:hypothetical protein